jgi:hypothetical protein
MGRAWCCQHSDCTQHQGCTTAGQVERLVSGTGPRWKHVLPDAKRRLFPGTSKFCSISNKHCSHLHPLKLPCLARSPQNMSSGQFSIHRTRVWPASGHRTVGVVVQLSQAFKLLLGKVGCVGAYCCGFTGLCACCLVCPRVRVQPPCCIPFCTLARCTPVGDCCMWAVLHLCRVVCLLFGV